MILNYLRAKLSNWLIPQKQSIAKRMYAAAKMTRVSAWGQSNTSADSELNTSLRNLRTKSRALVRDASYAKRAKVIIVNNVVGMGIGVQAQVATSRGQLNQLINDDIEKAWQDWSNAKSCHTGGSLHFGDLERMAMGQVFEAGEVFIRKHYRTFDSSAIIPFTLEIIEAERICDEYQPGALSPMNNVKMGIETDKYGKPVAYWIRELHPGELRHSMSATDRVERVSADQIIHLRVIDRWPQTRGEPWLHTAAAKLNDMDGYSEAEIVAARGAANYLGVTETDPMALEGLSNEQADGSQVQEIEPGINMKLLPGEKFNFIAPNRPNPNMDPFMRLMLREVAAGVGTSYESISRDYSQSNYSSSRLALIDDRDLWRTLQQWFIRNFREPIRREWLQQAVLSRAIKKISIDEYANAPEKFQAVRFKPRGWSWVDPTKEVDAYKKAIRAGFMTVGEVISLTGGGRDLEDVLRERKQELEMMANMGLKFDTEYKEEKKDVPVKVETQDSDAGDEPKNGNGNGNKSDADRLRKLERFIDTI